MYCIVLFTWLHVKCVKSSNCDCWFNSHKTRFNKYKSNMKWYGEGRRGFFQEKLIAHFFNHCNKGSYKDMMVHIMDFCDTNNQEKREDFWMYKLWTLYPEGYEKNQLTKRFFNWEHVYMKPKVNSNVFVISLFVYNVTYIPLKE